MGIIGIEDNVINTRLHQYFSRRWRKENLQKNRFKSEIYANIFDQNSHFLLFKQSLRQKITNSNQTIEFYSKQSNYPSIHNSRHFGIQFAWYEKVRKTHLCVLIRNDSFLFTQLYGYWFCWINIENPKSYTQIAYNLSKTRIKPFDRQVEKTRK